MGSAIGKCPLNPSVSRLHGYSATQKIGLVTASIDLFPSFNTVDSISKICRRLDSNHWPLALPVDLQPLPTTTFAYILNNGNDLEFYLKCSSHLESHKLCFLCRSEHMLNLASGQCDQMTRLFFDILPFTTMKINSTAYDKNFKIIKNPQKIPSTKISEEAKFWVNLVTLLLFKYIFDNLKSNQKKFKIFARLVCVNKSIFTVTV